jgi:hypothetical protein
MRVKGITLLAKLIVLLHKTDCECVERIICNVGRSFSIDSVLAKYSKVFHKVMFVERGRYFV